MLLGSAASVLGADDALQGLEVAGGGATTSESGALAHAHAMDTGARMFSRSLRQLDAFTRGRGGRATSGDDLLDATLHPPGTTSIDMITRKMSSDGDADTIVCGATRVCVRGPAYPLSVNMRWPRAAAWRRELGLCDMPARHGTGKYAGRPADCFWVDLGV